MLPTLKKALAYLLTEPVDIATEIMTLALVVSVGFMLHSTWGHPTNVPLNTSPVPLICMVLSVAVLLGLLALKANRPGYGDDGFCINIMRPVSGAAAVLMAVMFVGLLGESGPSLPAKITTLVFVGGMSFGCAMLFFGLARSGIEDMIRQIRPSVCTAAQ